MKQRFWMAVFHVCVWLVAAELTVRKRVPWREAKRRVAFAMLIRGTVRD